MLLLSKSFVGMSPQVELGDSTKKVTFGRKIAVNKMLVLAVMTCMKQAVHHCTLSSSYLHILLALCALLL